MPEFANPFTGNNALKKLNKEELIRAIRFDIAAEYEAVQLYTQLADSIDDKLVQAVLRDVADEELEHAGEFMRLLRYLSPDEFSHYDEGSGEVEAMMKKLKKK